MKEQAIKLRAEGLTYAETGKRLGVNAGRAHYLVNSGDRKPLGGANRIPDDIRKKAVEMFLGGKAMSAVAEELEISIMSVSKFVKESEGEGLKFSDIKVNDRLKKDGKLLIVTAKGTSHITAQQMDGSALNISRVQISKGGYEKVEPYGGSGPVTTYFIEPGTEKADEKVEKAEKIEKAEKVEKVEKPLKEIGPEPGVSSADKKKEIDYIDPDWGVQSGLGDLLEKLKREIKNIAEKDIAILEEMKRRYGNEKLQ